MKIQSILFLFIYTVVNFTCIAQSPIETKLPEPVHVSQASSDLAKYVEHPVSYGTGTVQIQIPLYEIKAGNMSLPISLGYHASGIKALGSESWLGVGWTLHAEPFVSRSVNGNKDEAGNGYLYNSRISMEDGYSPEYAYKLAVGETDEQPDKFYYNLPDKSGGFYFKRKRGTGIAYDFEAITCPYEPVKIKFTPTLSTEMDIWGEDGIHYRFGQGQAFEYTASSTTGNIITAWKATEMISPQTRDTIFFSYNRNLISNLNKKREILYAAR